MNQPQLHNGVLSRINYRDSSNRELQELCEDIDFDFDTLDISQITDLQSMYSDNARILWLEVVRWERETGA